MAFWSSQTIEGNLARLTDRPDPDMVDCNALTLRIGAEVYITPGFDEPQPLSHTKKQLAPGEAIAIPPGRFAFLLTEETVTIPPELMGFISIKATYKLKGLVNVSGFHVDPGWTGALIFTVFNSGPAPIHLQRGLPIFLLWIAGLDATSVKHKTKAGEACIPPAVINNISGAVDSIYAVEKRLKDEVKAVADKQDGFRDQVADVKERQNKILLYFGIVGMVAGAFLGVGLKVAFDRAFPPPPPSIFAPPPESAPVSSSPPCQRRRRRHLRIPARLPNNQAG